MSVPVSLQHHTRYCYERPVTLGPHDIRLRPAPMCRTPVSAYTLSLQPARHSVNWHFDAAGNHVARALFQEKSALLDIAVNLTADLSPVNVFDFLVEPGAEHYPFEYPGNDRGDLAPFLVQEESGNLLKHWVEGFQSREKIAGNGTVELLVRLNQRLQQDVGYVTRMEQGVQSCEETLRLGSGSCRDSGWLLAQILRRLGFAARFVSGYLIQLASDEPDAPKADSADLHAWAETYLPGAGWIGLDPTSGLITAEGHIPLARAATPAMAAPVTGSVEPSSSQMQVSMTVRRLS